MTLSFASRLASIPTAAPRLTLKDSCAQSWQWCGDRRSQRPARLFLSRMAENLGYSCYHFKICYRFHTLLCFMLLQSISKILGYFGGPTGPARGALSNCKRGRRQLGVLARFSA